LRTVIKKQNENTTTTTTTTTTDIRIRVSSTHVDARDKRIFLDRYNFPELGIELGFTFEDRTDEPIMANKRR